MTLPRASEEDISNYRSWMKEHNPIAAAETRFLDKDADLVALTPRLAASAAAAPVYMAIIIASGALLMPLLAFSMIAEFSGRLVVVTVTGGAAAAIAANYSTGIEALVESRDGWRCATLYVYHRLLAPGTDGSVLTLLIGTLASWPLLPCSFLEQNRGTCNDSRISYFLFHLLCRWTCCNGSWPHSSILDNYRLSKYNKLLKKGEE